MRLRGRRRDRSDRQNERTKSCERRRPKAHADLVKARCVVRSTTSRMRPSRSISSPDFGSKFPAHRSSDARGAREPASGSHAPDLVLFDRFDRSSSNPRARVTTRDGVAPRSERARDARRTRDTRRACRGRQPPWRRIPPASQDDDSPGVARTSIRPIRGRSRMSRKMTIRLDSGAFQDVEASVARGINPRRRRLVSNRLRCESRRQGRSMVARVTKDEPAQRFARGLVSTGLRGKSCSWRRVPANACTSHRRGRDGPVCAARDSGRSKRKPRRSSNT